MDNLGTCHSPDKEDGIKQLQVHGIVRISANGISYLPPCRYKALELQVMDKLSLVVGGTMDNERPSKDWTYKFIPTWIWCTDWPYSPACISFCPLVRHFCLNYFLYCRITDTLLRSRFVSNIPHFIYTSKWTVGLLPQRLSTCKTVLWCLWIINSYEELINGSFYPTYRIAFRPVSSFHTSRQ